MPLAEAAAGFRASFILLICAAAGTYAVQGELAKSPLFPFLRILTDHLLSCD